MRPCRRMGSGLLPTSHERRGESAALFRMAASIGITQEPVPRREARPEAGRDLNMAARPHLVQPL